MHETESGYCKQKRVIKGLPTKSLELRLIILLMDVGEAVC